MSTKTTTIIVSIIILVSVIAGILVYDNLPDPMASHWNINDEVDGYMSRFWGAFMMPLVSAGIFLLFLAVPYVDPLKENIAKFRETFNLFIIVIVLFLGYVWKLSIFWNLGFRAFKMSVAMLPALGLIFLMIGYMLRKAKRNWFIGIRTPWTLSSDTVWDKTHRLGSVLFMGSGILTLLGVFFGDYAIWFVLAPVLSATLFLFAYSFVLYQRENNAK